ncbi:hypothetical protein SprV_0602210400 [Sparganum proliferum]
MTAECVAYSSPSPPVPYPRLPKWIKNSAYPEAEIRHNLLSFSKAPSNNRATFQCVYNHRNLSISRQFNFRIYELWQVISDQPKASDPTLKIGEAYRETCSPNILIHNVANLEANFTDLVVEQATDADFRVDVKGNEVKCNSPKKWACFSLTCNIFVNKIPLPPVRRTRCYIERKSVSMAPHPKIMAKGSTLRCDSAAQPSRYLRMEWSATSSTGVKIPMSGSGSLGIIPSDFPGSSATVSCRAYFLIDGVKISVGEATASIQFSDMLDADLNYKNAEGISPGETVTCKEPANIFLPGDAEWNGFRLQDRHSVRALDQILAGPHLIGCEVRKDKKWKRKIYNLPVVVRRPELHLSSTKVTVNEKFRCYGIGFNSRHYRYKVRNLKPYAYGKHCPAAERDDGILQFNSICPVGLQKIECTVYGDAEYGIPETSQVLEINLLDYDTILMDDDIVLPPVPLLPLLMAWILWFCILFFNALFVAYLLKQNSLYRITQMQVMNRKRTGGTRLNRRMENLPFVYIQRSELDGQLFRRLRLLVDLYSGFLELGDRWFLLWTMNKKEIRRKLLEHFREFLEHGERLGRPSVRNGVRSRYVLSTYLKTDSIYSRAGQSTNFGPSNVGPRASVKK